MSGRSRGKRGEKPGRGCSAGLRVPVPGRTAAGRGPRGPLPHPRASLPAEGLPVSPRFCASFWSCSAVFAPPRLGAGSGQRFLLHSPRGSSPHPASRGSSGSHPSGKDISNRFEPLPPGLELEIISVQVLSAFYVVNTLPDLASPLLLRAVPVFLGCPGRGSARRTPGRPGAPGPFGGVRGAFLFVQLAKTGGNNPWLAGRAGPVRSRGAPFSPSAFYPSSPRTRVTEFHFPFGERGTGQISFPFLPFYFTFFSPSFINFYSP